MTDLEEFCETMQELLEDVPNTDVVMRLGAHGFQSFRPRVNIEVTVHDVVYRIDRVKDNLSDILTVTYAKTLLETIRMLQARYE